MTATAVAGNRTTWTIDPSHTTVEFVAKHMMITTVKGRFAELAGTVVADESRFEDSTVEVTFQAPSLDKKLSVLENLQHHGRLYGLSGSSLRQRCQEALQSYNLADRGSDRVETLSGGLARRVEIAKALLPRPRLLLLDGRLTLPRRLDAPLVDHQQVVRGEPEERDAARERARLGPGRQLVKDRRSGDDTRPVELLRRAHGGPPGRRRAERSRRRCGHRPRPDRGTGHASASRASPPGRAPARRSSR